jgi:hypothetical protein
MHLSRVGLDLTSICSQLSAFRWFEATAIRVLGEYVAGKTRDRDRNGKHCS